MSQFTFFKITEATTLDDIIKQYKERAKKYHPDMQTKEASKQRFQELQAEYTSVLEYLKQLEFEKEKTVKENHVNELIDSFINKHITNPQYRPLATEGLKLIYQILK